MRMSKKLHHLHQREIKLCIMVAVSPLKLSAGYVARYVEKYEATHLKAASPIPSVGLSAEPVSDNTDIAAEAVTTVGQHSEDTGNSSTDDQTQPQADVFSAEWWSQLVSASPIPSVGLSAEPVSIQNIYTGSDA